MPYALCFSPEQAQLGQRAKLFTSALVFGKVVEAMPVTTNRYGRTVAFVRVENISVNEEIIKERFGMGLFALLQIAAMR